MKKLYIILGLAVIILVLIRVYVRASRMSGFEGFAGDSGAEIVIAKWEHCGHCIKAMPEFETLMKKPAPTLKDGSSVRIRMIDAEKDKAEIESLGIRGYPTILFFKDGQRIEYDGPRTAEGVISFLKGY